MVMQVTNSGLGSTKIHAALLEKSGLFGQDRGGRAGPTESLGPWVRTHDGCPKRSFHKGEEKVWPRIYQLRKQKGLNIARQGSM